MNKKSDLQLVSIIEYDFENYNQEAINSAKLEIDARNLGSSRLQEIRESINQSIGDSVDKQEKIKKLISQGNEVLSKSIDSINPITTKKDSTILKLIAGYLVIILIVSIYQNSYLFLPEYLSIFSLEPIGTVIILGISVYGILSKKRIGWIILVGFLSYQFSYHFLKFVDVIFGLINEIDSSPSLTNDNNSGIFLEEVESPFFEYNPTKIIGKAVGGMLIAGGIVWFLCKSTVKRLFNISNELRNKVVVTGAIIGLLIWGSLLWG